MGLFAMKIVMPLVAALVLLLSPANAQTLRPTLDYASAAKIRDSCLAWASEHKIKVAIAIFDSGGNLIAFAHMDGAPIAVAAFAQWKGKSAAMVQETSAETAKWGGSAPIIANWGGGIPILTAEGVALGGVGTSGGEVPEDTACGAAGIRAAGLKTKSP
jgi:glc operon protein GlcG